MIKIKEAGFLTTVQDMGRLGKYHLGVPPSGAADKYSFLAGNLLVGNPIEFAALEMTLNGGKFEFHHDHIIALTGAPMEAYLNHHRLPFWETIQVQKGDIVTIKPTQQGVKSYLCISGGIMVPEVLGSKSTYQLSKIGGYKGRKLLSGDQIQINEPLPGASKQIGKKVPIEYLPSFHSFQELRATMGFSGHLVSDEGLRTFLNSDWTVSLESNRVAYRYTGAKVSFTKHEPPFGAGNSFSSVVDFAYPIGSIMLPNEEEIIVLLNDGTTGGGFVTIGTVISQDLDLIAQSRPLSKCRFRTITIDEAIRIREEQRQKIDRLTHIIKNSPY